MDWFFYVPPKQCRYALKEYTEIKLKSLCAIGSE
jgi:hypothetical protein